MVPDPFAVILKRSIGNGLAAAALVDRDGNAIAQAGAITEDEAMPLVALVMYRSRAPDLADRLFAGEIVSLQLDEREVAVCVAKRQLFIVAVLGPEGDEEVVRQLRNAIGSVLADSQSHVPLPGRDGDGGAGPAELALAEYGITMPRTRPKA